METKFNFKSQVCTDRFQSERLLALGLKKETADCGLIYKTHDVSGKEIEAEFLGITTELWESGERTTVLFSKQKQIPAWSLHRMIEMCDINPFIFYTNCGYDNVVDRIEELIKEGYFNKEYLV